MEALAGGLRDPKSKYPQEQQDLMFFAAARKQHLGGSEVIARRLCELGVPCNSFDRLKQTPLFFAAREGNRNCAAFLVEQRCEVNHRDAFGQSPLFYSVRESHVETCRLLIQLGASFDIRDNYKNTAIYYAKGEIALSLARMLDERLARETVITRAPEPVQVHPNPDGRKVVQVEKAMLTRRAAPPVGLAPPPPPQSEAASSEEAVTVRKRRRLAFLAEASHQAASTGSSPAIPLENGQASAFAAPPRLSVAVEASPRADSPLLERPPPLEPRREAPPPLVVVPEATRGSQRLAAVQPQASPRADSPLLERPLERRRELVPPPPLVAPPPVVPQVIPSALPLVAEATSCRGSQRLAAVQAIVSWSRVGTDGAAATYPRPASRSGGDAAAGSRGPPPVIVPSPDKVFAQAGEYCVCAPSVSDAWRLRELEREFVLDHFDVFSDEPWHGKLSPLDWCRLVNVIESEDMARQAIISIIAGRTPRHGTLQCLHVPRTPPGGKGPPAPPSIVGYVHVVNAGGHLDVSHLKVQRAHQRKGLGSLLIAGTVRWAEHLGVEVRDLRLVVVVRNSPALSLYRALGFEDLSSVQRQDPLGGGTVKWQKMWRPFNKNLDSGAFARFCEQRAVAATSRTLHPLVPSFRLLEPFEDFK